MTARDRQPSKSGFAFVPRSMCAAPRVFGRTGSPFEPVAGMDESDPRVRAAQLQHLTANAVREELLAAGQTIEKYLEAIAPDLPGLSYDRLTRVLRGQTQMQLADVMFWADRFDRVKLVVGTALGLP
ncbi:MAG: helix-turn-helix domain-containing protein [Agromyces sp.]